MISAALFVLGLYLSLRTLAACYRIVDLWYAIRSEYPRVLRSLVAWLGGTIALLCWLQGRDRAALACGLALYLAFFLSLYLLRHLVLRRPPSAMA